MRSHLLTGKVWHHRVRPVDYAFQHDVFYLAVDLDELDGLDRRLALLGRNRANVVSLRDADHFDGRDIREAVRAHLGLGNGGSARITMVTYPRIAGYVFNPVTFYLVHEGARLTTVLAEVHNTHHERHVYRLEDESGDTPPWRSSAAKRFYVSPFLAPGGAYAFSISETLETLDIRITESEAGQPMLSTGMSLARGPLNNRTLAAALLRTPFVTLKTTAMIHFHAFKLWRRRVTFYPHGRRPGEGA